EAMRYSIEAGGKRLRPILVIASGEAVGGTYERMLPIACAIEMVHTYSLIHDDLPSMDDDYLRRGVPSSHAVYGEALAILAGDALLTDSFFVIARSCLDGELSPLQVAEIIAEIARAAGSRGMVRGQALDLALEGKDVSVSLIEEMHVLKTASLIEASVVSGAIAGGATAEQLGHLRLYARALGLAFQIVDDLLDIEGGSKLGKAKGADLKKQKATYPAAIGIEGAKARARALTLEAIDHIKGFDERAVPLREIARYLGERKY
ncbi:MAG: polyprenyl synthetase family protein, partial [Candidatus Caldarchaeum sp.]